MNDLYTHPSQIGRKQMITITDAAYERMKSDPEYEEKVLNCFRVNKSVDMGTYLPTISVLYIDDTWEKSYGYTQGMEKQVKTSGEKKSDNDSDKKELQEYWKKIREEREYIEELHLKNYFRHKNETEQLNKKSVAEKAYNNQLF